MFGEEKTYLFFVIFVKLTYGLNSASKNQSGCATESKCILLKDCKSYINVIGSLEKPLKPYVIDFLRGKQCGFYEGYPKVCCSDLSRISKINTQHLEDAVPQSCNKNSRCVLLKNCRPFLDLIKTIEKPLKPAIVDFLRAQQCGFKDGYPTVCCPRARKNIRGLKSTKQDERPKVSKNSNNPSNIQKKINAINTVFQGEDVFGFLRILQPN